jgi:hypothetical protein
MLGPDQAAGNESQNCDVGKTVSNHNISLLFVVLEQTLSNSKNVAKNILANTIQKIHSYVNSVKIGQKQQKQKDNI